MAYIEEKKDIEHKDFTTHPSSGKYLVVIYFSIQL